MSLSAKVGQKLSSRHTAKVHEPVAQRSRYEILRVVNRGGMGEIALAKVTGIKGFEKLVVLKRLRADAEREDHIAMFDVEQEVMSRMEHPNVVQVFDQPVLDHVPYLAMEYVRGRNLDQIIRNAAQNDRKMSLDFTLSVISEVLRGLAFVHHLKGSNGEPLGVVHQDMTPSNVMVSFFGEVKIMDFGISYVTSRDGGLRKGVLKGKPRYVAPEVLAGKRVNNTADIYGVGVVMYEMLVGKPLFARSSVKETLSAVAKNELPDFSEKLAEFGPDVVRIMERATKKDPAERYRKAELMAVEILNVLKKRAGPVPAASLGLQIRGLFINDPDVPEIDPALEEAIVTGTAVPSGIAGKDLNETLLALDEQLGGETSILFEVPPEIHNDLSDMNDSEPFSGKTPLPNFMLDATTSAEQMAKAQQVFELDGGVAPPFPLAPVPPLTPVAEIPKLVLAPPHSPPPRTPPPRVTAIGPAPVALSYPELDPKPPTPAAAEPGPPAPALAKVPAPVLAKAHTPTPVVDAEQAADQALVHGYRAAPRPVTPAVERPTNSSEMEQPAQTSAQFWMGLAIGLAVGTALGYLVL